jgi:hypothetical protein
MDTNKLRSLQEAYLEVVENEQLDEDSRRTSNKQQTKRVRQNIKSFGSNYTPPSNWDPDANRGKGEVVTRKQMEKKRRKSLRQEDFEFWVNALVEEGYDLSDYTWDEMYEFYLDEAEGSYGQTPKARAAMGKVAIARRKKPASEYSQKGEKTRKVKEIEKHTRRIDNGPDAGDRGKKSTKPRWSGFAGRSGRGKLDQDSRDYSRETSAEYGSGTSGSGTVTKNPKKLRKQKAMGEIAKGEVLTRKQMEKKRRKALRQERVSVYDIILSHLLDEGYAETVEGAEAIMVNMSEEWRDSIIG